MCELKVLNGRNQMLLLQPKLVFQVGCVRQKVGLLEVIKTGLIKYWERDPAAGTHMVKEEQGLFGIHFGIHIRT